MFGAPIEGCAVDLAPNQRKNFGHPLVTSRTSTASFLLLQEMAAFSGALIGTLHVGINFYPCSLAVVECQSSPVVTKEQS